jgi:2'-5' RNA ligase
MAPYRRQHLDVRWTRLETWHLTLLFLGAVDPARVPELHHLIDDAAHEIAPYRAQVAHGGGRSRRGEGVAWLGLGDGAGALIEAATLIAANCPSDITEGPPPKRTSSAHLTIVRKADEAVIEALRSQAHGPLGVGWTVDALRLVRSHLDPAGARYETLHQTTL